MHPVCLLCSFGKWLFKCPQEIISRIQVVPYVGIERYWGNGTKLPCIQIGLKKGCFRSTAFYEKLEKANQGDQSMS
ncbi:MAG: hypothetical protein CM1200mP16_06250 [Nitrospina sp.]|nr:MAG: hypothetical protein CM1200mP16_06250 [Nitrospina sp.]